MNKNTGNFYELIPKRVGYQTSQSESILAFNIISALSNITLANDMMDEYNKDGDIKLFLDIIKRNCNRINQMIIEIRKAELSFISI